MYVTNEYSSALCARHSWEPVSYIQRCEWMFYVLRIHSDSFNGSEHPMVVSTSMNVLLLDIMDLSAKEACSIVEHYFHSSSFKIMREWFHAKFGDERRLYKTIIKRVVEPVCHEHTLVRWKESGCQCSIRTSEQRQEVYRAITAHLRLLVQKLVWTCQMSVGSVNCMLHELKLYPIELPYGRN